MNVNDAKQTENPLKCPCGCDVIGRRRRRRPTLVEVDEEDDEEDGWTLKRTSKRATKKGRTVAGRWPDVGRDQGWARAETKGCTVWTGKRSLTGSSGRPID